MQRLLLALTLGALALTGCGGPSDDTASEAATPAFSAQETQWAETNCEVVEGLKEYENPEGFDRCVEDSLPAAEEGIERDRLSAEATTAAQDDPRCKSFLVVRQCMEVFYLDPADLNYPTPQPVTAETEGAPQCDDLWAVGNPLPLDYTGCIRDDEFIPTILLECTPTQGKPSQLHQYNGPDDSYYAFTEEAFPDNNQIDTASNVGEASGEVAILSARDVCIDDY